MNTSTERKLTAAAAKVPRLERDVRALGETLSMFIHEANTAIDGLQARCKRLEGVVKKTESNTVFLSGKYEELSAENLVSIKKKAKGKK